MKSSRDLIWEKLNSLRTNRNIHFSRFSNINFFERLLDEVGNESLDRLINNQNLMNQAFSQKVIIPNFVIDFIDLFNNQSDKILDPCVNRESYIIRKNKIATGYIINKSELELIQCLYPNAKHKLFAGDGLLTEIDFNSYQSIISFPPFVKRINSQERTSSRDYSVDLLVKCCNGLSQGKLVMMLCSARIGYDSRIKKTLKNNDIGIKALFHLPNGSHLPYSQISSYLTIAEKGYRGKTFVAELSENEDFNQIIFKNYQKQTEGKKLRLGIFKDFEKFNSFEAITNYEELLRKGKNTGYIPTQFNEILCNNGVKSIRDEKWGLDNHNSNCIYIPKVGNSNCVTHPSELKPNVRNCLRIELKNGLASPEYLVKFFNSNLGRLSLDSCKSGTAMQSIKTINLKNALLFIPNYTDQIKAISIDNKVSSYINKFEEMRGRLWSKPKERNSVLELLKPFEKLNSIEGWFEGIPFPLSSILWKYYSKTNSKEKYDHLLHFFEALPEFLSMIYLSCFYQNKDFYNNECKAWLNNDPRFSEWYKRSDFGGWNNQFASLAKSTRTLLNNKEKKELTFSLLGKPNSNFLNFITSKSVFNILDSVRQYRSDWKAHGGVSSNDENESRLTILEEKLNELRSIINESFSTCQIVVPGTSEYKDGIFKYKVKVLVGNRIPFNEIDVESIKPMDTAKLYMLHEGQNTPVELLPFIKYDSVSKACYYYNKIESGNSRWVSFHYEKTSELRIPLDNKFEQILAILSNE